MIAKFSLASIFLAVFALALGYGLAGLWGGALSVTASGLLWLLGRRRDWDWMASVVLIFLVGAAAGGLWLDLGAGWMLIGVVAALSAWDLDHFARRLRAVGRVEGARDLERRHLLRLLIVDGLGLLLAAVALKIKVGLSFGAAFLLGLLAVVGLSRAVLFLRHGNSR
jgi:hypothetical protein